MLLADRYHGLRDGVRGLLETEFETVFMVADEASLLEGAGTLTTRLRQEPDLTKRADLAIRTVLSRPARPDEVQALVGYMQRRQDRPDAADQQVVWALLTSAEFRFNH